MTQKTDFLSNSVFDGWRGQPLLEEARQQEQRLEAMEYNEENAIDYLNQFYRLSYLYRQTFRDDKLQEMVTRAKSLPRLPGFKEETDFLATLVEMKALKEVYRNVTAWPLIEKCFKYALNHDKHMLLCIVLNDLGNHYRRFGQNDLGIMFYALSADLTYQFREEFSPEAFREQVFVPLSNLALSLSDYEVQNELSRAMFHMESVDLSTRLYMGELWCGSQGFNVSQEEQEQLGDLRQKLYGDRQMTTSYRHMLERYYKDPSGEQLKAYLDSHREQVLKNDLILGYILWLCQVGPSEHANELLELLDEESFILNASYLNYFLEKYPNEVQKRLLQMFLNYLPQARYQLDYSQYSAYIDFCTQHSPINEKATMARLLQEKSGANGAYEEALLLVNLLMGKYTIDQHTDWLDSVCSLLGMNVEAGADRVISEIRKNIEENCDYHKMLTVMKQNLTTAHNVYRDKDYVQEQQDQLTDYTETARLLFLMVGWSPQNGLLDETGSALMRENPYYKQMWESMKEWGWETDERDLNINLLHASKDDKTYTIYLFHRDMPVWLADEEKFNGEAPLWFSENSHVVSPVFRLREYAAQNLVGKGEVTLMVVMMPPTSVVNASDMVKADNWNGIIVVKFQEVMDSLQASGQLPQTIDSDMLEQGWALPNTLPQSPLMPRESDEWRRQRSERQAREQAAAKSSLQERRNENRELADKAYNDPWNFLQVYQDYKDVPYVRIGIDDYPDRYQLQNIGLQRIIEAFFLFLADNAETQWLVSRAEGCSLGFYFKNTSVKFKLVAVWHADEQSAVPVEFSIDSYNSDRLKFIRSLNQASALCDGPNLYCRGNITAQCETVVSLKNVADGMPSVGEARDRLLELAAKAFGDALVEYPGQPGNLLQQHERHQEKWMLGVSNAVNTILYDQMHQLAEQTAKAAIVSRNMSHNLGSHVMAYLKRDLASVGDIIQKGVLEDFYPLDLGDGALPGTTKQLLERVEARAKDIEMPFLVGLGKFISYLQERQDFIATIATDYIPYFSAVNFKDDVYDTLNPDFRYLRHPERRGNRPENLLLKYIAKSEGLSRNAKQLADRQNDIVIRFRDFDGLNDYDALSQELRGPWFPPDGPGEADLTAMRDYSFYLPSGIVGRQALFCIMENLIRNAAKHGNWRVKGNLEFTFDIHSGRSLRTEPRSRELYEFLQQTPTWEQALQPGNDKLERFYIMTLTDNLDIQDENFRALQESLKEEYVDENGIFINNHKGIKEIRISAAWMRGLSSDLQLPPQEPPVVTIRQVPTAPGADTSSLQYIFCLLAPKKVLLVCDDDAHRHHLRQVVGQWEGWYVSDSQSYSKSHDKTYDVIALEESRLLSELRPRSSDRLVRARDVFSELYKAAPGCDLRAQLEDKLYRRLYGVLSHDEPLLISDERTPQTQLRSSHIRLVSSDATALQDNRVYRYAYRTHHQDEQEFSDYMAGGLRQSMEAVEGITGSNATDRLIRNEELDDVWYYKHLNALRTEVAIFDERLFSNITGVKDEDLLAISQGQSIFAVGSRQALVYQQKRVWLFNVIPVEYKETDGSVHVQRYDVFGFGDAMQDAGGDYRCRIVKVAEILPNLTKLSDYYIVPSAKVRLQDRQLLGKFYYLSIHQGLLDKLYDAFGIKQDNSYTPDVRARAEVLQLAKQAAKYVLTNDLYRHFHEIPRLLEPSFSKPMNGGTSSNDFQQFCPGFFIHSGRSKPSEFDMPQRLPFIQYAAIEYAVYDCKYSLVELLKSARYE